MRLQSRLPASCTALLVPRNQPQVTFYLVKRVSMLAMHTLPLARDSAVVRMVQQLMQAWWEHFWPTPLTQEGLHLHAFADKEHAVILRALLNLVCAALTLLGCPLRGSLQRETTLCQR